MSTIIGISLVAFILFIIQRKIYTKLWNKNLHVKVRFLTDKVVEGERGELVEVIENRKRLPLIMLKVNFQTERYLDFSATGGRRITDLFYKNDIFQVRGGERISRTLSFLAQKRGYYKILNVNMVGSDLFFTVSMNQSVEMEEESYLYVYPRPYHSQELQISLQQLNGEVVVKRHMIEDPFEYRGIREYQVFDDIKTVNWKATAKTGELKVNQKNYTALPTIRIFFNLEDHGILRKDEAVEATLQIVAGITEYFLAQGIRVAVYGNGNDKITGEPVKINPNAGNNQIEHVYRTLARVDAAKPAGNFVEVFGEELKAGEKGSITVLVSPNQYDDFLELLKEFHESGRQYVWFYPVWESEDPQVPAWAEKNVRILHIRK